MKNLFLFPIDDETQTEEAAAETPAAKAGTKAKAGAKAKTGTKKRKAAASGKKTEAKTATKSSATKKRTKKCQSPWLSWDQARSALNLPVSTMLWART